MPTNEAEVPPQLIWISLRLNSYWRKEPDPNDIPYVPASALSEAWEKAIAIVRNEEHSICVNRMAMISVPVGTFQQSLIEALEAARDAALSAGKGATSEEVGQGERNRRPFTD